MHVVYEFTMCPPHPIIYTLWYVIILYQYFGKIVVMKDIIGKRRKQPG